jgi:hypothetical protein
MSISPYSKIPHKKKEEKLSQNRRCTCTHTRQEKDEKSEKQSPNLSMLPGTKVEPEENPTKKQKKNKRKEKAGVRLNSKAGKENSSPSAARPPRGPPKMRPAYS